MADSVIGLRQAYAGNNHRLQDIADAGTLYYDECWRFVEVARLTRSQRAEKDWERTFSSGKEMTSTDQ